MRATFAVIGGLVLAGCFVERPSKIFECRTTADCLDFDDDRSCRDGYCVVSNCPGDCTDCDEEARTCLVHCSTSESCGSVQCPSGWDCTIQCVGTNACADVDCRDGSTCAVTCSGSDACETVDCRDACRCDLTCAAGACNPPECPSVGNGNSRLQCTSDGTEAGMCDSSFASGCAKC